MAHESAISPEMRLFSPGGERLYLNADERQRFLAALDEEAPQDRMFCQLLHYNGCRPTEACEVMTKSVLIDEGSVMFHSLKKRKTDSKGRIKQPQYRTVPVPPNFIENLDLVFHLRKSQKHGKDLDKPLWPKSRATAWRLVKRVMTRANIKGKQATSKGLRHGFGIAMMTGKKPLALNLLSQIMGHSDTKITEIYLQFVGAEKHSLVMDAWGEHDG